jgi:hypothetical protein
MPPPRRSFIPRLYLSARLSARRRARFRNTIVVPVATAPTSRISNDVTIRSLMIERYRCVSPLHRLPDTIRPGTPKGCRAEVERQQIICSNVRRVGAYDVPSIMSAAVSEWCASCLASSAVKRASS